MREISKSEIDKNWSEVLKKYRLKAGLTQEKLSEKVGISDKYISRIERGQDGIKTQTLIKYINALSITPNEIYKPFIDNPEVLSNIELSEKIKTLSEEKKAFVLSIIELLKDL